MGIGTEKPEATSLAMRVIEGEAGERMLGDLLDHAFAVPTGAHYFDDFPIWSGTVGAAPDSERIRIGVYHGDRLLSAACARIARMKVGHQTLRMGLIGAVATQGEFRGAGLAGKILEVAIDWLTTRQAAYAVLWGNAQEGLYAKLGFEPFGEQAESLLVDLALDSPNFPVHQGWTPRLFDCLAQRPNGLVLTSTDRMWLERHRNVRWFWTGTQDHPTAYAALGKGIDLPGFVHEWGGERSALHSVLSVVRDQFPESRIIGSPKMFSQNGILPLPTHTAPVCLVRVLDPDAVQGIEGSDFWLWGLDGA